MAPDKIGSLFHKGLARLPKDISGDKLWSAGIVAASWKRKEVPRRNPRDADSVTGAPIPRRLPKTGTSLSCNSVPVLVVGLIFALDHLSLAIDFDLLAF